MIKTELLAPVGRYGNLEPVVEGGADAVYLGAKNLNMRAMRPGYNFSLEELAEAIPWLHSQGVKAYITVNSLVEQDQLQEAAQLLAFLQEQGADGVIVQDLGIINLAKKLAPGLPIHASTQMNIHNSLGARMLENWGIKRVVLARELNLAEIKKIKEQTKLELEFFVFGTRCSSYSGQCYLSTSLGRGGGNQGRCSKPCRLLYQLNKDWDYFLSPKDTCLLNYLPQLIEAGISSLKIEGRMEDKIILKEVVSTFRWALDNPSLSLPEEEKRLEDLVGRSFTAGYLIEKPGKAYFQLKAEETPNISPAFSQPVQEKKNFSSWLKGKEKKIAPPLLAVWVSSLAGFKAAGDSDIFYLGGQHYRSWGEKPSWSLYRETVQQARAVGKRVYWALPSIVKDEEIPDLAEFLEKIDKQVDGLLVANLGILQLVQAKTSLPLCLERELNIFNPEALELLTGYQIERICLHPENHYNLTNWPAYQKEVLVWGPYPGLVSENCLGEDYLPAYQGEKFFLKTENNRIVQVETDIAGRSHVFPRRRLNLLKNIAQWQSQGIGVFRLDLRGGRFNRLADIVKHFRQQIGKEEAL